MNEVQEQLTPLSKIDKWEHSYVINLCKKGRVAHKTDGTHYLVCVPDIEYHIRQVQLLRMTPKAFNVSLSAYLALEMGLTQSDINTSILNPRRIARSRKHA